MESLDNDCVVLKKMSSSITWVERLPYLTHVKSLLDLQSNPNLVGFNLEVIDDIILQ